MLYLTLGCAAGGEGLNRTGGAGLILIYMLYDMKMAPLGLLQVIQQRNPSGDHISQT